MKRSQQKRTGVAMFFTIATIVVVSMIVYAMMSFMRGEVHLSGNYVDGVAAVILAEAGVEQSLYAIKRQMNDPKNPIYQLITKKDGGNIEVDLSELEGKGDIKPLIDGGKVKARITWKSDPNVAQSLAAQGLPSDIAKEGTLVIESKGTFHKTSKQIEVKKAVKAVLVQSTRPGNSVGMVAPNHGMYLNAAHQDSFKVQTFDFWDPWGFTVKDGKVFMRDGARVDLPKWMILASALRHELEHPFLDMGMGWSGWNGGANLTESSGIEYVNSPVTRNYYKWQGLFHFPWWRRTDNEPYNNQTKQVESYEPKAVNLYPPDVYRRLANRVVDPQATPSQGKYFKQVNFSEAFGRNQVTYSNVVPLYGWGDWRKVPNKYSRYLGNPTKAHDTTHAVEVNGLTFIKGDVYLEGWVKGKGLLVVQGNVYVGGDILSMTGDDGSQSSLGVIALRDKTFDHSVENPLTGRIIYQPHHDSDWSRLGVTHPFRNMSPRLEGCFHAEGGLELNTDSSLKKLINMEIVGNLSTDYFDRRKMPNDVSIKYFNWQEVLSRSDYDYTVDHETSWTTKYDVSLKKEIVSWREVDVTL